MADGAASRTSRVSKVSSVSLASDEDLVQVDQKSLAEELAAALEPILEQHHARLVDSLRVLDPLSAPGSFIKDNGDSNSFRRSSARWASTFPPSATLPPSEVSRSSTFSKAEEIRKSKARATAAFARGEDPTKAASSVHHSEARQRAGQGGSDRTDVQPVASTPRSTEGILSFGQWEEAKRERSLKVSTHVRAAVNGEKGESQEEEEGEEDMDWQTTMFSALRRSGTTELKKQAYLITDALTRRANSIARQQQKPLERPKTGFRPFDIFRWWIQAIVESTMFELVMSGLIMSNTIFCGVEVDYMARNRLLTTPAAFHWLSVSYAVIFATELVLRLIAEGRSFLREPNWAWNVFDATIVIISFIEVTVGDDFGDEGGRSSSSNMVPSVRVIRMARVVRILRIARIMRHFRSLRVLIYSVLNTLRSLFWTLVLLTLILYVFAIVFTQATTQHVLLPGSPFIRNLEDSYGTVGRSMYTLFKAISGGVSWQDITVPLGSLHSMWLVFFLIYFAFTYFAVLNVVTGVFCQTAIESANLDQEMATQAQLAAKQLYVKRLKNLFKQINANTTGFITLQELEDCMQDEKMRAYFASIDLSVDEAFSLFKLLDANEDHALDIEKFVTGCLKLRGHAKSIDLAMMMYENRWNLQKCLTALRSLEEMFHQEAAKWASI